MSDRNSPCRSRDSRSFSSNRDSSSQRPRRIESLQTREKWRNKQEEKSQSIDSTDMINKERRPTFESTRRRKRRSNSTSSGSSCHESGKFKSRQTSHHQNRSALRSTSPKPKKKKTSSTRDGSSRSSSSSSSMSSSSSSDSDADERQKRKERKKLKKEAKRLKKAKKKEKKLRKKMKKEKKKKAKLVTASAQPESSVLETNVPLKPNCSEEPPPGPRPGPPIPELSERARAMKPMTKEEWDKRQSIVRKVYDEETGRHRLIKGDGEVLEEIVSRDRHREINRQATQGDGNFFQTHLSARILR